MVGVEGGGREYANKGMQGGGHMVVSRSMRLKVEREGTGAYCSATNNTAYTIAAASNGMTCFVTAKLEDEVLLVNDPILFFICECS